MIEVGEVEEHLIMGGVEIDGQEEKAVRRNTESDIKINIRIKMNHGFLFLPDEVIIVSSIVGEDVYFFFVFVCVLVFNVVLVTVFVFPSIFFDYFCDLLLIW